MNYKEKFLQFVDSLSENQLNQIGHSEQNVCWDGREFYLWAHDVRNDRGDELIFDSATGEGPFNAKDALMDFSVAVGDLIEASKDE